MGRALGSALRDRPLAERELAGALAPLGSGRFTAAAAAVEVGLAEETAEELLERMVEGAVLEMAGIDADGRPRYRFHELMRLPACGPTDELDSAPALRLTATG